MIYDYDYFIQNSSKRTGCRSGGYTNDGLISSFSSPPHGNCGSKLRNSRATRWDLIFSLFLILPDLRTVNWVRFLVCYRHVFIQDRGYTDRVSGSTSHDRHCPDSPHQIRPTRVDRQIPDFPRIPHVLGRRVLYSSQKILLNLNPSNYSKKDALFTWYDSVICKWIIVKY